MNIPPNGLVSLMSSHRVLNYGFLVDFGETVTLFLFLIIQFLGSSFGIFTNLICIKAHLDISGTPQATISPAKIWRNFVLTP